VERITTVERNKGKKKKKGLMLEQDKEGFSSPKGGEVWAPEN